MLAETEFAIRSRRRPFYREVLLGLFFITVGMLLDVGLLLRICASRGNLAGMLLKTAVVTVVAKPATKSWFSKRAGVGKPGGNSASRC